MRVAVASLRHKFKEGTENLKMPENEPSLAQVSIPTDARIDLRRLTPNQLAELGSDPEMLETARAEVYRRLKDDPRKANFLTFRWLLPSDEEDRWDAYDGLIKTCWNAVEKRHAIQRVSFVNSSENLQEFPRFQEAREAIQDELIPRLGNLKSASAQDIIQTALGFGFQTDVDVANAVRQRVRQERRNISYQDAFSHENGEASILLEFLEDGIRCRNNTYSSVVELVQVEKAHIEEVIGEKGWEVLWSFVGLIDADSLPSCERDRERILTEAFMAAYDVEERQARTHKKLFRMAFKEAVEAGENPVFEKLAELLGWEWQRRQRIVTDDCRETPAGGNGN
jgi:hypothetical protein